MRLIDADALKEGIKELKRSPWYNNNINPSWRQGIKDAVHVVETLCIDEEPTVDAVPVIRCKDCKFSKAYYHGSESNLGMFTYLCTQGLYGMNADDYCSRAERKEE